MSSVDKATKVLKKLVKYSIGRGYYPRVTCQCRKERFGSDYGGWDVAIDGINDKSMIYSVGIGEDISFDLELIDRFGVKVFAFDPTPRSVAWINDQYIPDNLNFFAYGIADKDGELPFHPPADPRYVSHSILEPGQNLPDPIYLPVRRVRTVMAMLGHTQIDVLKMDIEGAEYAVIDDLRNSNIRPLQLLVEFHHRFRSIKVKQTQLAVRTLREMGYRSFSVSESGEEYGFILIPFE